jgi:hypothetical protein
LSDVLADPTGDLDVLENLPEFFRNLLFPEVGQFAPYESAMAADKFFTACSRFPAANQYQKRFFSGVPGRKDVDK